MEEIKGLILIIISVVAICVGLTFLCITIENKQNNKVYSAEDYPLSEWVSPDGVHYWCGNRGYKGYMAPRYDNNGNLVIDKE